VAIVTINFVCVLFSLHSVLCIVKMLYRQFHYLKLRNVLFNAIKVKNEVKLYN